MTLYFLRPCLGLTVSLFKEGGGFFFFVIIPQVAVRFQHQKEPASAPGMDPSPDVMSEYEDMSPFQLLTAETGATRVMFHL